jgi:CcmD family protein
MNKIHTAFLAVFMILTIAHFGFAQNTQYDTAKQAPQSDVTSKGQAETVTAPVKSAPEMADRMRADGKIYVVVAIILTILTGFIVYLILMDRKVRRLEALMAEKKA